MKDQKKPQSFRVRKYLIYPKIQLKFASILFLVVAVFVAASIWFIHFFGRQIFEIVSLTGDAYLATSVQTVQQQLLETVCVLGFITLLAVMGVTILITHRFVGPIVALIRYFEALRNGERREVGVRDYDGLGPLVEYIRSVRIEVYKRDDLPK